MRILCLIGVAADDPRAGEALEAAAVAAVFEHEVTVCFLAGSYRAGDEWTHPVTPEDLGAYGAELIWEGPDSLADGTVSRASLLDRLREYDRILSF